MENEIYAAGLILRNLPTGIGYVNFVSEEGTTATYFKAPPVPMQTIPDSAYAIMRNSALKSEPTVAEVLQVIEDRTKPIHTPDVDDSDGW